MSQLQCPNCGGFKIGTPTQLNCGCVSLCFFIGGVMLFWGVPALISGITSTDDSFKGLFLLGSVPFIFIGGAFLFVGVAYLIWYHYYSRTHHICLLCGYRWEQRDGQPAPKIHVRPDLIAMGAKRLEEEEDARRREEEERRKRQQDKELEEIEKAIKKAKDL
jgi:hypothetical protein